MPDIANSGCLILWGYNPSFTRLTHATATVEALKRGMKLIVVDPRHVGLASKADLWLRVRPGTDGALALGLANVMIERGWYDRDFIRDWSNGPLLVRADTGRLLTERDLAPDGDAARLSRLGYGGRRGWCRTTPPTGRYDGDSASLALRRRVPHRHAARRGDLPPGLRALRRLCRRYPPEAVEATCWIPRAQVEEAARLIWHSRPVSYYAWSGHEQHANATQTARAMSLLYALTGSFDAARRQRAVPGAAGRADHRRGPARGQAAWRRRWASPSARSGRRAADYVTTHDLYRAILEGTALPGARLVGFGANLLLAHADGAARARGARGAGLLRPRRPVHEPDRRARRHRAAGRLGLRARGAEDRLRDQRRGAVAGPAAPGGRAAARRGAVRHRHHLRPRRPARPRRAFLERRHRGGLPPPARARPA